MKIERIIASDLTEIKALTPADWSDIGPAFEFYLSNRFCYPIKYVVDGKIVGVGSTICFERTAWLGHIIVESQHRNKGIGNIVTQALIDSLRATHAETILLIATQLGEPVYKKCGFEKETEYVYMKNGRTLPPDPTIVTPFQPHHKNELLELDKIVSGENRSRLLEPHFINCQVIMWQNRLQGFFMPSLGEGLIIARTPEAGMEFLKIKHKESDLAKLPVDNNLAIEFLKSQGFVEYARGSRMWRGKKLSWYGDKIYSRIGGNLG